MAKQTTFGQVANNAQSTLSTSYAAGATTIVVATGHGSRFPTPGNGFYATIWDANTYADPFLDPNMEVVKVTARSTDTMTVTRAQRGTSAVSHNSGDAFRLLVDSTLVSDLQTAVNTLEPMRSDNTGFYWIDEMFTVSASSGGNTLPGGQFAVGGNYADSSDASHPGCVDFSTSTLTTGYGAYLALPSSLLAGGGQLTCEAYINIPTLSTVAEEYAISIGFGDTSSSGQIDQVDGAYLQYKRGTSVNWLRVTASNSSRTANASSTAVATGWNKVKVVINAAGTSVEYFVNGVSIGTETTNIPTGAGRNFGLIATIKKSAGTTSRQFSMDYISAEHTLTTAR